MSARVLLTLPATTMTEIDSQSRRPPRERLMAAVFVSSRSLAIGDPAHCDFGFLQALLVYGFCEITSGRVPQTAGDAWLRGCRVSCTPLGCQRPQATRSMAEMFGPWPSVFRLIALPWLLSCSLQLVFPLMGHRKLSIIVCLVPGGSSRDHKERDRWLQVLFLRGRCHG